MKLSLLKINQSAIKKVKMFYSTKDRIKQPTNNQLQNRKTCHKSHASINFNLMAKKVQATENNLNKNHSL